MCLVQWGVAVLLVLVFPDGSGMVLENRALQSSWDECELRGQNVFSDFKRHSDGTFSSDFTQYLDRIKAKDFVQWLASTKRESLQRRQFHRRVRETIKQEEFPLQRYKHVFYSEE
ncbi:hypothetical protein JZ751_021720 [Albula glossodonta]|uniref:Glucagon / GIP / secretin / VIP family domain-containing protein n=1 Tax=Albula glossodonta TaxID=121402 RepID=A0A8T2NI09_9TELE|nr:hypothetical protein JZ751_021720 [Albula glossodonta]